MKIVILKNGCKIRIEDAVAENLCKTFNAIVTAKDVFTVWNVKDEPQRQMIALDQIAAIVYDESYIVDDSCKSNKHTGPGPL